MSKVAKMDQFTRETDRGLRYFCRKGKVGFIVDVNFSRRHSDQQSVQFSSKGINIYADMPLNRMITNMIDEIIPVDVLDVELNLEFSIPSPIDYSDLLIPLFVSFYLNEVFNVSPKIFPALAFRESGSFELNVEYY